MNYYMKENKLISIVIPCFNESQNIQRIPISLDKALKPNNIEYEIIYVDNGGKDNQLSEMLLVQENYEKNITIVSLSRNFGYQGAIRAGLDYINGDGVVFLDADLQDPPEIIVQFFKKWEEGYEIVCGYRKKRRGVPVLKFLYKFFLLYF